MVCIDVLGGIAHYLKSAREDFIISCFEYPRATCQIKKINQAIFKLKEAEKLIMSARKLIADDWTLTKQSEPNNPLPVCDCEKCSHYHVCHYNRCGLSERPTK